MILMMISDGDDEEAGPTDCRVNCIVRVVASWHSGSQLTASETPNARCTGRPHRKGSVRRRNGQATGQYVGRLPTLARRSAAVTRARACHSKDVGCGGV